MRNSYIKKNLRTKKVLAIFTIKNWVVQILEEFKMLNLSKICKTFLKSLFFLIEVRFT